MPLNRERAYQTMQSRGVDAVIASSPENVYYVSDYWSLGQQLRHGTQVYALLPVDGDPAVVAPFNEADLIVESGTWISDVYFYGDLNVDVAKTDEVSEQTQRLINLYQAAEAESDAASALLKVLKERGLTRGVLALDTSAISPSLFGGLQRRLSDAKLVEGSDLLREIRLIKTGDEVARIQRATEITEKSMEDALEIARTEIMELDMAGMFGYSVAYDGGRVTLNLIGFGERSAFPNPIPSDFEARRGDVIRMTLGCTWRHYHSNISRTAVIGRPPAKVKKRWEAILAAQDAAFDEVRPGVQLSEVYAAAVRELEAAGLKCFNTYLGHGLGVECNERPWIGKGVDRELMEGMVINIDVPYLELGFSGVQLEDTVLVTEEGSKLLTRTDRTLYIL